MMEQKDEAMSRKSRIGDQLLLESQQSSQNTSMRFEPESRLLEKVNQSSPKPSHIPSLRLPKAALPAHVETEASVSSNHYLSIGNLGGLNRNTGRFPSLQVALAGDEIHKDKHSPRGIYPEEVEESDMNSPQLELNDHKLELIDFENKENSKDWVQKRNQVMQEFEKNLESICAGANKRTGRLQQQYETSEIGNLVKKQYISNTSTNYASTAYGGVPERRLQNQLKANGGSSAAGGGFYGLYSSNLGRRDYFTGYMSKSTNQNSSSFKSSQEQTKAVRHKTPVALADMLSSQPHEAGSQEVASRGRSGHETTGRYAFEKTIKFSSLVNDIHIDKR